jgi:3-oxoacyl-[acyl-carrier protein] reductase
MKSCSANSVFTNLRRSKRIFCHKNGFRRNRVRLPDKVAVVTGAGAGIGRASASLFGREGARVVVADINEHDGRGTVDAIKAAGGEAIFVRTDVSVSSEVEKLISAAVGSFGRIDILFNNAGMGQKLMRTDELDEATWDLIHNVNLKSIFLGMKYALPHMRKEKKGVIINTGSMAAVRPRMHAAAYVSSKAAVIMLTKAVALEVAGNNIRVNCINPVVTFTTMMKSIPEEERNAWARTIPIGRIAQPEDMANAALYLASDESSMVTGICLDVDGGRGI